MRHSREQLRLLVRVALREALDENDTTLPSKVRDDIVRHVLDLVQPATLIGTLRTELLIRLNDALNAAEPPIPDDPPCFTGLAGLLRDETPGPLAERRLAHWLAVPAKTVDIPAALRGANWKAGEQ
ncbi:hypothetical protein ACWGLE_01235 [Streptomyces sp. NPDC055897]